MVLLHNNVLCMYHTYLLIYLYIADLIEHLDRLGVTDDSNTFGDREKLLDSFVRQNYLIRSKSGNDPNNENSREYYWGTRARAEVTGEDILGFIVSVCHNYYYYYYDHYH